MASENKKCNGKKRSECESGWQARFMNCKWDEAIGCYAANGKSPTVGTKSNSSAIHIKAKETKDKKFGPNIDDCTVPACKSTANAFHAIAGGVGKSRLKKELPCPIMRDELGRNTWSLLHTMAANYPDNPSAGDQSKARYFIESLARFYPCRHCAEDFQADIERNPPNVTSRIDFSIWMCEAHNRVNVKLGSPKFDCDIKNLDLRWRDGGKRCT